MTQSDIIEVIVLLALAYVTYKVAFRRGAQSTIDDAQHAVNIMEEAIENLAYSQEELNAANEEMTLLHSQNVGLLLDALDHHIAYTRTALDPDHLHIVEQIRPYYTAQTIH